MGRNYDVREMTEADLDGVAATFTQIFNRPPWNDEWTETTARRRVREIRDAPGGLGHVAADERAVYGFVLGRTEQWDSGRLYNLQEMGVRPDHQRRGIGTALVDHLSSELRKRDVERMYLLTMKESPAASFYERTGFYVDESTRLQYAPL